MMNKNTETDNRQFTRFAKPLVVKFSCMENTGWKTFYGVCQNISEGGVLIKTNLKDNDHHFVSENINLSIFLSGWEDKIDTLAEIIWTNTHMNSSQSLEMGLKFLYLPQKDRNRLLNFIYDISTPSEKMYMKSIPLEVIVSTIVKQDIDKVYQLIKDMEKFPKFMGDVIDVSIIDEIKNISKWKLAIEDITVEWVQETLFDDSSVKFKMVSGDFKSLYGEWKLMQLLTGTKIELTVVLEWGIPILERYVNSKLNEMAHTVLESMLRAIKKKMWIPKVKTKLLKFASVIHPLDVKLFSTFEKGAASKRETIINKILEWTPPFEYAPVTGVRSLTGKRIDGELILCPLLPEQIITLEPSFVIERIIEAGHIAEKLGAKIFSLAAYTAQVGRKGILIKEALKIPVTTGTNYTIATTIEGIIKAAKDISIDIRSAKICIVGATGSIGSICANIFSEITDELLLVSRNQSRLFNLAQQISQNRPIKIQPTTDIDSAIRKADIIITMTNTPLEIINMNFVQPGTLIYDISLPKNVSKEASESRKDVLVVDGGVVRPPGEPNFNLYYGLPMDLTYACIAEAMILTLEERFECYSIGGNVSLEKVKEVSLLASKHGFQLAELHSFGKPISTEQIEPVKKAYVERKWG